MSNNSVILVGRLGQDVALRHTGNGNAVANFSVAVQTGFGDKKKTDWVNVVAWNSLAELAQKTFKKGSAIAITGRLATRKFKNSAGAEVSVTEVVANSIGFPEEKEKSEQSQPAQKNMGVRTPSTKRTAPPQREPGDESEGEDGDFF